MKLIKKIAAIMLSIMMVLGMASVVSAEESGAAAASTGTITINKAAKGETYKLYRILDLESYSENNFAYKVRTYESSSTYNWSTFIKGTDIENNYVKIDNNYVTWIGEDTAERKTDFIKKALEYAHPSDTSTSKIEADATEVANEETVKFENLSLGYYLIESSTGTLCALDTTHKEISIDEKNNIPSVEKKVKKADSTWGDNNTASIGDKVEFKTTITAQPGARKYVLHDKMDAGLTFDGTVTVKKNGTEVDTTNYTLKKSTDSSTAITDDCTFEIAFHDTFCDGLKTGDTIVVTYSATLNKNAVIAGNGNENETWLSYGNSSETIHDKTTTKTYSISVFKYTMKDTQKNGLANARFTLSKVGENNNSTLINLVQKKGSENSLINTYRVAESAENPRLDKGEITTPDDGKFTIEGLSAGTYHLTETKQPDGYNKLSAPIKVVIAEDGKISVGDLGTEATTVEVENKSGTILPSTGGNGTSLIYFLGAVLALGSSVVLITKKRMR